MTPSGTRSNLLGIALVVWLYGSASPGAAAAGSDAGRIAPRAWPEDVVTVFSRIPVQDAGRIKPLSTYARFELIKLNSRASFTYEAEESPDDRQRLGPMEWLLDVLFFPDVARHYRCFAVDDDQVLKAVGLTIEGRRRRDRYSFAELEPVFDALSERATEYAKVEGKQRTPVQQHTLRLASSLVDFERLSHYLDFARGPYSLHGNADLAVLFGGRESVSFEDLIARIDDLVALGRKAQLDGPAETAGAFDALIHELERHLRNSQILRILPPAASRAGSTAAGEGGASEEWLSPFEAALRRAAERFRTGVGDGPLIAPEHAAALSGLARMAEAIESGDATAGDAASFGEAARDLLASVRGLAQARGEYGRIPIEVSFYRGKFFWFNPWFFLVGFLLVSLAYASPVGQRWLARASIVVVVASLALLITGIVYRCVIRGRPPVSTLYETILFVTAVGVAASLVAEWLSPRRIALGVAAAMGCVGMFLANRYELHEATDTMPQLVAVLDTNFWLATHVTTISVGYAAGLFASAIAHVYLIARLFRPAAALRSVARMIYGLLCFGLLFSLVGTILGGVWANDSWGRFWGWDPKENGALLIVLSQLMILHARLGGYIREFGLALCTVLCGMVVVFSWWGVNLLGVGLHSYGFTAGAALGLKWFYGVESGFLLLIGLASLLRRMPGSPGPRDVARSPSA